MKKHFWSCWLLTWLWCAVCCWQASAGLADTLTVTNTGDSGPGSLRQAILDADAASSGSFIQFNIPTSDAGFNATTGAFIINVNAALPALTANGITIDGSTQTSFTGHTNTAGPEVVLNGSGRLMDGLVINSAGCAIRGLVVNGFAGSGTLDTGGIKLTGATASGNRVDGCFLGTDATGTTAVPNFNGIVISGGAHNNLIGGTTTVARNVLSGNKNDGIHIIDQGSDANVMQGNFIGVDVSGVHALPNQQSGIGILDGVRRSVIGGVVSGARNIISGNTNNGIFIGEIGSASNLVQGNYLGLGADGATTLPTSPVSNGVAIVGGASGNVIGGLVPGARNILAGNNGSGVFISGSGTKANVVQGNYIGTDVTGTRIKRNSNGVAITSGAQQNLVGGTTPAARNIISGNGLGIWLTGANARANQIQGNYIGLNPAGVAALPNTHGVFITNSASANHIGGIIAGARNVISGSLADGVHISDSGTNDNIVQGNYIGTNLSGTSALPNSASGVAIVSGASDNIVGGIIVGARNLISGNAYGVYVGASNDNIVQGNYIGTNVSGTAALANKQSGVSIVGGASHNLIGGLTATARNVISGNSNGVQISDRGTTDNVVQGNYIGTNVTGTGAIPNLRSGIAVVANAQNSLIGGTSPGARNLVSGNQYGVYLGGSNGNVVQGNYIGTNVMGNRALPNSNSGIAITYSAQNNVIGGLSASARNLISGNTGDGIHISDAGTNSNIIEGNFIGINASGAGTLRNTGSGVAIVQGAQHNVIGGTLVGSRNVISANDAFGVVISSDSNVSCDDNIVQGNYLGTNASGTAALGNAIGIKIGGKAQHNTIGGTSAGARNLISGNAHDGILMGFGSSHNVVQGNYIGTNANGTAAIANGGSGVALFVGANNLVGGVVAGARNLISGNNYEGVVIVGAGTDVNTVQGNYVGTDITGTKPLSNRNSGILVEFGAKNNLLGGATPGAANLIFGNRKDGIRITGAIGNTIRSNVIFSNGGLGINLQPDGEPDNTVTPNDLGDTDTGPNNLQNFPIITQVISSGSTTIINGTLNSTPNRSFDLDFYRNTTLDASGYGEGEVYLGTTRTTTNSSGNGTFSVSVVGSFARQFFTVTATNASTGDTSEFSKAVQASAASMAVRALGVAISTADASVAQSSIQLNFNSGLESEGAADSAHYLVLVNGHAVGVQSVGYDSTRHRVTLEMETGSLSAGSEVVVHWQDLLDAGSHALADGSKTLLAH